MVYIHTGKGPVDLTKKGREAEVQRQVAYRKEQLEKKKKLMAHKAQVSKVAEPKVEEKKPVHKSMSLDEKRSKGGWFVNRALVRQYALEMAKETRAGKFSRVGECFIQQINADARGLIRTRVQSHPSRGKTLMKQ
jgi:hypothetical protein